MSKDKTTYRILEQTKNGKETKLLVELPDLVTTKRVFKDIMKYYNKDRVYSIESYDYSDKPHDSKEPIFVKPLEHRPLIDKILTFFLKPIFLAGLYSLSRYTAYLVSKTGYGKEYYMTLLSEAMHETMKEKGRMQYLVCNWSLDIMLQLARLDNAYNNRLYLFLQNFIKKCKENKYMGL